METDSRMVEVTCRLSHGAKLLKLQFLDTVMESLAYYWRILIS
jgi:hypothetical protein